MSDDMFDKIDGIKFEINENYFQTLSLKDAFYKNIVKKDTATYNYKQVILFEHQLYSRQCFVFISSIPLNY